MSRQSSREASRASPGKIYAGTSGFAYPTWKPRFYPDDTPATKFLAYYSARLNAVEINYTFRRLPAETTLARWVQSTPEGFLFCLKAHQRLTHILRLKDSEEFMSAFLRSIDPLQARSRLGAILFQLPPFLRADEARLARFLAALPSAGPRCAFEFRHESWFSTTIYKLLEKHRAALCWAEAEDLETPHIITAPFVYMRLRKPEYSPAERSSMQAQARKLAGSGCDVFLFFKHEETPEGALYAEELLRHDH